MRVQLRMLMMVGLSVVAAGAMPAWAVIDVTGSYDGMLVVKKQAPVPASATFTQAGKFVTGTIVLSGDASVGGGVFLFGPTMGKIAGKQLVVKKAAVFPLKLNWTGKVSGDIIKGKLTVKGAKRTGTLTLTKNPPLPDASACDAVYTANQMQFHDLRSTVLGLCASCHEAGLQAASTRFQITDELPTARSLATMVSSSAPASSRILLKPTNALPHGGAQQIVPGSDLETKLRAWVDLIAAAHCNGQ